MTKIFLEIVNMSISAGWLILAVLLLRLLLKKAPKWLNVALWGLAGIRLAVPFSIESIFSLIPSRETISPDIMLAPAPTVNTGIPALDKTVNPVISASLAPAPGDSVNPLQIWVPVFTVIWGMGMLFLFSYTVISYWRLRKRVAAAIPMRGNIYRCERVASPFVLGIIRPRIYLPFHLKERDVFSIIAHEQAHIRRKDHLWKPLGFLLLTVHWFNPLVWLANALLCRDIELACDEKVIRELDNGQRADYSQTLLACSVNRKGITACPLAFGETDVKKRVKSVLNYRKPAFWIIAVAVVACVAVALCFLTDPARQRNTVEVPQLYPDSFDMEESQTLTDNNTASGEELSTGILSENILPEDILPGDILPLEFLFASGAGGWGTTLILYPDGHFEGVYEDGEAVAATEYPRGTSYICKFSGQFSEMTRISDYAYSMRLEELSCETEVDKIWIEDEIRYIGSDAFGVEGGEEFILYLPGASPEGLDEDFLSWWPDAWLWRTGSVKTLSSYGICNVNTGQGFFTSWLR